tara:strand:+ start:17038 stop:17523 length:486 start_codon:yes stop_codon:yes gene_type:complete
MKGKQSVAYRTCDDSVFSILVDLPKGAGNLFIAMLEEVCKNDNCLQVDMPTLRKAHGWDKDNCNKHLKRLKKDDVVKSVYDIDGIERLMINPSLVWSTGRDKLRFACNMYSLGSHAEALNHTRFERSMVGHIDPDTGEISGNYQSREEELIKALADVIGGN